MYILYTRPGCPFCEKAKELLASYDLQFEDRGMTDAVRAMLVERYGARTVPQIFDGEMYIGGYEQLRSHLEPSVALSDQDLLNE